MSNSAISPSAQMHLLAGVSSCAPTSSAMSILFINSAAPSSLDRSFHSMLFRNANSESRSAHTSAGRGLRGVSSCEGLLVGIVQMSYFKAQVKGKASGDVDGAMVPTSAANVDMTLMSANYIEKLLIEPL